MQIAGIYTLINIITGKYYVGSSIDIHRRWWTHKTLLNKGIHDNDHLQKSWNKYGSSAFILDIIQFVPMAKCRADLLLEEQKYLDIAAKEKTKTYNLNFDAQGGILSEYSKRKLRGKNHHLYGKKGSNHPAYGYKHTEIAKDAIRHSKIGVTRSAKFKKNLSKFQKKKYKLNPELNPNYDKTLYTFNHKSGIIFTGTPFQLRKMYNLNHSKVSMLIHRTRKSHRGWSLTVS